MEPLPVPSWWHVYPESQSYDFVSPFNSTLRSRETPSTTTAELKTVATLPGATETDSESNF